MKYYNLNLTKLFKYLNKNNIVNVFIDVLDEHLSDYNNINNKLIYKLTDFDGDTSNIFITKNKLYLLVDGRFEIQSKKQIKDSRIKIININSYYNVFDFLTEYIKNKNIFIDYKKHSIDFINKLKCNEYVIHNIYQKKLYDLVEIDTAADFKYNNFILLYDKYVSYSSKFKINNLFDELKKINDNIIYITSNLSEIAYLTNIRSFNNNSPLFNSFFISNNKINVLYTNEVFNENIKKYLLKSNIKLKPYSEFYDDLKNIYNLFDIKNNIIFLDKKNNNFYIYNILKKYKNNICLDFESPLYYQMSIRTKKEISNIKKANEIEGALLTNIIYDIKHTNFGNNKITEFDIKNKIDSLRSNNSYFLQNSFETIVAYKENAAICHYVPKSNNSKLIKNESVLLIDTGGNYVYGTTDTTRTISLYKKNKIPNEIKYYYTLVLKSFINMHLQIFLNNYTGSEIDIISRAELYNNFLNYNHGTGHGIGFINSVHFGPNGFGKYNNKQINILAVNQIQSIEPGLYFENKFGIRIENDVYIKHIKSNNFGSFNGFEYLTYVPIDMDLVDKKMLEKKHIYWLNKYNKIVYNKLKKYFKNEKLVWLKNITKAI